MNATIRIRRDTAANWTAVNPVLASGEPGLETNTRKVKYGDGVTAWNSLEYAAVELPQMGATSGQVLTWNGTAWTPATPASGGIVAWNDITGKPSTFTPSAHSQAASTISDSTSAGRALLTAADVAAQRTALGLGGAAVLNVGTSSGTVAAGDHTHSGVYAAASHTHAPSALTAGGATSGQILMWNGTAWAPSSAYVDNAGLSTTLEAYVTSTALTSTLSDYVTDTELANALSAYELLPQLGATSGQVLTWNGTAWAPATPASGGAVAWNDITGKPSTFTPADHNQAASTISDSTSAGRALLTAADVAAQRTALALGGAAVLNVGTSSGTVAAGDHTHSGVYEPVMTAASQAEMEAGTETAERKMSPLRVAQAIAALAGGNLIDARMLSAAVQSFSTTLASAGADLEFTIPSAGTYALFFFGDYLSSTATEGLKLGYDFTGTQTGVRSFLGMLVTSSTETYGVATALNTATTGTAGPGASTSWPCFGRLRIVASSSGTVKVCFATETASGGASVTLNPGFFCMLLRVNAAA